ncbi:MAG: hypothetical protein JRH11_27960, partial [Deltaproteobacteria bacterium]|nr:hypothetical protein [Deltaproteobacteria bacterium]
MPLFPPPMTPVPVLRGAALVPFLAFLPLLPLLLLLPVVVACGGASGDGRASSAGVEERPTPLGPRVAVPGTGVSVEAPVGATLLPIGPGVGVDDLGLTIMVALAIGPEPVHEAFRQSLFTEGTGARRREVTIQGQPATLGRDALPGPGGAVARAWLITRRGDRTLAVLATYRDGGDGATEELVLRSLETLSWDETRRLSPDRAIGLGLGEVEGLEMDRGTLGTLALTPGGGPFPPLEGEPMMFVLPLAEAGESAEGLAACAALLTRTGAVTEATGDAQMLDAPARGCAHDGVHRS